MTMSSNTLHDRNWQNPQFKSIIPRFIITSRPKSTKMVQFATSSIDFIPRPVKTYHKETYSRLAPANSSFDAKGKTVLITAGATGIGFSISKASAEAGVARIIIISRRREPQAKAKAELEAKFPTAKVETFLASVTDKVKMTEILKGVEGGIDVLVLCAAAPNQHSLLQETTSEYVNDAFRTNV